MLASSVSHTRIVLDVIFPFGVDPVYCSDVVGARVGMAEDGASNYSWIACVMRSRSLSMVRLLE